MPLTNTANSTAYLPTNSQMTAEMGGVAVIHVFDSGLRHLRHLSMAHTPRGVGDAMMLRNGDGVEPTGVLLRALGRLNQSVLKRLRLLRAVDTLLQELAPTPTNPNWP